MNWYPLQLEWFRHLYLGYTRVWWNIIHNKEISGRFIYLISRNPTQNIKIWHDTCGLNNNGIMCTDLGQPELFMPDTIFNRLHVLQRRLTPK